MSGQPVAKEGVWLGGARVWDGQIYVGGVSELYRGGGLQRGKVTAAAPVVVVGDVLGDGCEGQTGWQKLLLDFGGKCCG